MTPTPDDEPKLHCKDGLAELGRQMTTKRLEIRDQTREKIKTPKHTRKCACDREIIGKG